MSYEVATGIVCVGVQFIMAYLATQFNKDNLILQLFFLIVTVGMFPLNAGLLLNIVTDASASAGVLKMVNVMYWGSVWVSVVFIALLMLQFLYKAIVSPVNNMKDPYNTFVNGGIK